MTIRVIIPYLLIFAAVVVVLYVIVNLMRVYVKQNKTIEYNDLTNDSLLKEVNNNLTVIKYCMIFFVVTTIFVIISVVIAYIIYLLR